MANEYLKQNIRLLRKSKNLTLQKFGDIMGVGVSTAAAWENEKIASHPKIQVVDKLCKLFGITIDELCNKDLSKIKKFSSGKKIKEYSQRESEPMMLHESGIPVYNLKLSAGPVEMYSDDTENPAFRVNVPGYEDCDFGMFVYGHSMYPTIENGSLILGKRIKDKGIIIWGEMYVVVTQDYRMVKRLQRADKPNMINLLSDNDETRKNGNPKYEVMEIERDKIEKLFLVKGIIKKIQS
jgi:transcriptional regulator with XRE-family HTH domain